MSRDSFEEPLRFCVTLAISKFLGVRISCQFVPTVHDGNLLCFYGGDATE